MKLTTLCFPMLYPHWVLLGWKKRGFGAGKLNGWGGKVHPGETIREAARREVFQECHLEVITMEFRGVLRFIFDERPEWNSECHLHIATEFTGIPAETEEMRPQWFTEYGAPFNSMWESDILWLPEVLSGKIVFRTFHFNADQRLITEAT